VECDPHGLGEEDGLTRRRRNGLERKLKGQQKKRKRNIGIEVHTNTRVADTRVHTLINTVIMSVWNAARSISIIITDIHGCPVLISSEILYYFQYSDKCILYQCIIFV
jgi:hypothetical protein